MGKDDFQYLCQECDSDVLDLFKQKELYPYEYMNDFEKFKTINIYAYESFKVH